MSSDNKFCANLYCVYDRFYRCYNGCIIFFRDSWLCIVSLSIILFGIVRCRRFFRIGWCDWLIWITFFWQFCNLFCSCVTTYITGKSLNSSRCSCWLSGDLTIIPLMSSSFDSFFFYITAFGTNRFFFTILLTSSFLCCVKFTVRMSCCWNSFNFFSSQFQHE